MATTQPKPIIGPFASGGDYLESDIRPHYDMWKSDPSLANTSTLLKAVDPIVSKGIRRFGGASAQSPNLRSKAKQITAAAFKTYDPTRSKLQTYLLYQLQGLQRIAAKEERVVSIPEQLLLDSKKMHDAKNELSDNLGREPSDAELSDHLSIPLKRLNYIRQIRPVVAEGAFAARGNEEDERFDPAVQRRPGSEAGWLEFVYHDLDPTNQLIMEHTLGLHGKRALSNQSIARKLKVSPGAVSQRKAVIQNKLDLRDELGVV